MRRDYPIVERGRLSDQSRSRFANLSRFQTDSDRVSFARSDAVFGCGLHERDPHVHDDHRQADDAPPFLFRRAHSASARSFGETCFSASITSVGSTGRASGSFASGAVFRLSGFSRGAKWQRWSKSFQAADDYGDVNVRENLRVH